MKLLMFISALFGRQSTKVASCANTLCLDLILLRDEVIVQRWLEEDSANREVFNLAEAVEFSARFFVPLMSASDTDNKLSLAS